LLLPLVLAGCGKSSTPASGGRLACRRCVPCRWGSCSTSAGGATTVVQRRRVRGHGARTEGAGPQVSPRSRPAEGADREAQLRQLAAGPSQVIFGVGFLFSDDVKALAKEFPDKKFACIDFTVTPGESLPPNLVALTFRGGGSYLVGALSGAAEQSHNVGFVGGMEIPLIQKFPGRLRRGSARRGSRVPRAGELRRQHGRRRQDPTKGKELALAEYHAGADIIFHASGSTGLGVFEAARELPQAGDRRRSDQYHEALASSSRDRSSASTPRCSRPSAP